MRRNELICGIPVKCNVMEAAGTGFEKIMQEYEEADEKHRPVPGGTVHDEKVLAFCYDEAKKASEIAGYLELSDSTYFRKKVLGHLTEYHYLEREKLSGIYYYRTNRAMVRRQRRSVYCG